MSKTSKIHTRTYQNKWVRIELRSGERFTAQFEWRTSGGRITLKRDGHRVTLRKREISRFICFGSFSPNSDFSKTNPWDTVNFDQL